MRNSFKEDSIYTRIVNEARYLNITLMFIVQSALSIPAPIREGASIVFCKRVNDKKETRELAEILNLTSKEQSDILMYLKRPDGIFINKEKGSIPVSIINPAYPVLEVTDEEIEKHQFGHLNKILEGVIRKEKDTNNTETEGEKKRETHKEIDYDTTLVIQDLVRFPFDFQAERAIRLNINVSIISKILTNIIENGLIEKPKNKINLGKGKSPFQPYLLTKEGIKRFGKQKIKGKGSLEHAFWQYRCSKYFNEKNYNTEVEYFLNDGRSSIDVVAIKGNEKIAIEIELNKTEHIQHNILKCMNAEFNTTVIAVYGSTTAKYVETILLTNPQIEEWYRKDKIILRMLPEFLD